MCRNAAIWRWNHSTKNKKLLQDGFFFPWKEKKGRYWALSASSKTTGSTTQGHYWDQKSPPASSVAEAISSFLEWLGTAVTHSSTQPKLGLGPITQQYPTAAPAPTPRTVLLVNADQCPWETSLPICGSARRTKLSLFLLASNHTE